jgi:hypothetical protein
MSVRARYRPSYGALQPQQSISISLSPPMEAHEQPVLLSPENRALIMKTDPEWVQIRNSSDAVTPYLLVIVPQVMIKAARHPWSQVAQGLAASLQTQDGRRALLRSIAAMIARSS